LLHLLQALGQQIIPSNLFLLCNSVVEAIFQALVRDVVAEINGFMENYAEQVAPTL
jgi:hypothetical protein